MRIVSCVLMIGCVLTGCSDASDSPTSPSGSETASQTTEMFTGDLEVGGLRFYAFRVPAHSAFSVLLGSLRTSSSVAAADLPVGLGVGIPAGTSCTVRDSVVTTPALTTQFSSWATEGIHCIAIYDVGYLRDTVTFAIRLTHY